MNKTIITASLTGAITPAGYDIPETPQQIADCAYECWKLGAAVIHLHMRDEKGLGCMDKERFLETVRLIRSHKDCDVVINCTSSGDSRLGGDDASCAKRMEHFQYVPGIEIGSYDAGSFNWMPGAVFLNPPKFLKELGELYQERGIKPEVEVFDAGMLVLIGFSLGGAANFPVSFTASLFGRRDFNKAFAPINIMTVAIRMLGFSALSLFSTITGSVSGAYICFAVLLVIGGLIAMSVNVDKYVEKYPLQD